MTKNCIRNKAVSKIFLFFRFIMICMKNPKKNMLQTWKNIHLISQ